MNLSLLILLSLLASSEHEWEVVATGAITVKARPRGDTKIFEIWAEADLAAPVRDIQDALTTMERFPKFLPYVRSARQLSREPDGSVFTYTELGLPVISDRDYVVHVWLDEGVKPDGSGVYRTHWEAAPDKLPERKWIVRVKVNEGSWEVTPIDATRSHVVYKFAADPGGMLPTWAKNLGNRRGVSNTLQAIEKEAQLRQRERAAEAARTTPVRESPRPTEAAAND